MFYIIAYSNIVMLHPWVYNDKNHAKEWIGKSRKNKPIGIWRIKPKTNKCRLFLSRQAEGKF